MALKQEEIQHLNRHFKGIPPEEIISWAVANGKKPVVTTNFRPYEVAILHAVTQVDNKIPVIWCDTGYHAPQTYRHAADLIERLGLNREVDVPSPFCSHR